MSRGQDMNLYNFTFINIDILNLSQALVLINNHVTLFLR